MEMQKPQDKSPNKAMEILLRKLEEAKIKNPLHSQRAFAQRLGLSSGCLSEILNGKRNFSNSLKKKIAEKLALSPKETLDFFESDLPSSLRSTEKDSYNLSQDQFLLIADWWYFAILNLVNTKNFKNQTSWISKRLDLPVQLISEAWQRLIRLGYLEKTEKGYIRKQTKIKTTDELMNASIRRSHLEDLKLIENSLLHIDHKLRDNTSSTFTISTEDIPKAKELIRIFHKQLTDLVEKNKGNEVYKISISLYPLTKVTEPA